MLFHLTRLLHPPDKTLIWGAVVLLFLRGTEPPGGRWTFLLKSCHTKHNTDALEHLHTHTHTHIHTHLPMHLMLSPSQIGCCTCMHGQKTHTCTTHMEWKKQRGGDTCSKKTLIYIPKCSCQIPPCKRGSITNKWTYDKKEKIPFKSARVTWIFYANGISNEVELSSETLTVFPQPSIKIYATADL